MLYVLFAICCPWSQSLTSRILEDKLDLHPWPCNILNILALTLEVKAFSYMAALQQTGIMGYITILNVC